MNYLDVEQVKRLHKRMLEATGGMQGLKDEGALISAINNAFSTFDGNELYPTLLNKAAIICYCLIANHPFNDGNKRIGLYVMLILLEMNGFILDFTQDELITLGLGIAEGKIQPNKINNWLEKHLRNCSNK